MTVNAIVRSAGMTSAAFYYHFASREEVLEVVVRRFAGHWIGVVKELLRSADSAPQVFDVPAQVLDQFTTQDQMAHVYFVSAATAPASIEQVRRETRNSLIAFVALTLRELEPSMALADAQVAAIALLVVTETAVRTRLTVDDPYRQLGDRRFRQEISRLGQLVGERHTAGSSV